MAATPQQMPVRSGNTGAERFPPTGNQSPTCLPDDGQQNLGKLSESAALSLHYPISAKNSPYFHYSTSCC